MAALSQLSYSPELILRRHLNTHPLPILRWRQPEVELLPAHQLADPEEVGGAQVWAVGGNGIDLARLVDSLPVPRRGVTGSPEPHRDHVAAGPRPLALHPKQLARDVEDQVIPPALHHRPGD